MNRRILGVSLLLLLATVACYGPLFSCQFINLDDPDYVTENLMVRQGLSWAGVAWAFSSTAAANWHPLTWLSHMLDCQAFDLRPMGHHSVNLLFHALNSLLLFWLLKAMTATVWRSAFVAALFALHPIHVESVAWISERKDVLSCFFGILTIWTYMGYTKIEASGLRNNTIASRSAPTSKSGIGSVSWQGKLCYLLTLLFFALGLMSKPMLVTLPFALLLLDYWPLGRFRTEPPRSRTAVVSRLVVEKIPLLLLVLASCVITIQAQAKGGALSEFGFASISARLSNVLVSYARYLGKLVFPADLAVWYPPASWDHWQVAAAAIILGTMTTLALWQARRRPYLIVGWLWFLGTLVPVIGLIKIGGQSMADRYAYLPSIGLFLLVAWGCHDLGVRSRLSPGLQIGTATCAVLTFALLTIRQSSYWQDSFTLFTHTLAVTQSNELAHDRLGDVFLRQQKLREAEAHLLSAIAIAPQFAESHYGLGLVANAEGHPAEAVAHWRIALQLKPEWLALKNNLAWLLATCPDDSCRNPAEAVQLAQAAAAADPRNPSFFDTLGAACAAAGKFGEAIAAAEKAVALAEARGLSGAAARFRLRLQSYKAGKAYQAPH
jgi:protein O-mannosyl-transferase